MEPLEWVAVAGLGFTAIGALWTAFTWLVDRILTEGRATAGELRADRDYWRGRAERLEEELDRCRDGGGG